VKELDRRSARRGAAGPRPPAAARPLDLLIGLAAADRSYCDWLLADPLAALALAPIPLPLKRRLVAIRASGLGEFALEALVAEAALEATGPGWPAVDRSAG
jgi:hypothetical protein